MSASQYWSVHYKLFKGISQRGNRLNSSRILAEVPAHLASSKENKTRSRCKFLKRSLRKRPLMCVVSSRLWSVCLAILEIQSTSPIAPPFHGKRRMKGCAELDDIKFYLFQHSRDRDPPCWTLEDLFFVAARRGDLIHRFRRSEHPASPVNDYFEITPFFLRAALSAVKDETNLTRHIPMSHPLIRSARRWTLDQKVEYLSLPLPPVQLSIHQKSQPGRARRELPSAIWNFSDD